MGVSLELVGKLQEFKVSSSAVLFLGPKEHSKQYKK